MAERACGGAAINGSARARRPLALLRFAAFWDSFWGESVIVGLLAWFQGRV